MLERNCGKFYSSDLKPLISFLFVFHLFFFADAQPYQFENLTKERGLVNNYILSIYQDEKGYTWIGTYSGLQRYDGNEFYSFISDKEDSVSISNHITHAIFNDKKGRLWFGTENGLNLFDPATNGFRRFYPKSQFKTENSNHIRSIAEDDEGILWLATYGGGLISFNPKDNTWQHFLADKNNPEFLPSDYINTLFFDSKNHLWIGTEAGGLSVRDKITGKFTTYGLRAGFSDNTIASIIERHDGKLWVGTWRGGLNLFDKENGKVIPVSGLPSVISKGYTIRHMILNPDSSLWIATQNGLINYSQEKNKFSIYQNSPRLTNSIGFNYIWCLNKDKNGILWIGTFGGGLSKLDPLANRFTLISNNSGNCAINDDHVTSLFQDSRERIWVASVRRGIDIYISSYSCVTEQFQTNLLQGKHINVIYEDKQHFIWCEADGILYKYDLDLKLIYTFDLAGQGIKGTIGFTIYAFTEDEDKNLWMGGWNTGLLKLSLINRSKNKLGINDFEIFNHNPDDTLSLSSDIIWSLMAEKGRLWIGSGTSLNLYTQEKGFKRLSKPGESNVFSFLKQNDSIIWLATAGSGLLKLNPLTEKAQKYKEENVLEDKSLLYLSEAKGNLWIISEDGLYMMNLKTQEINHFTTSDGLPTNTFLYHVMSPLKDGRIIQGTVKGIVEINPSTFLINRNKPVPVISDVRLFNKSISLEHAKKDARRFQNTIDRIRIIELSHDENVISFAMSSIQYTATSKAKYAYHLEGFDKEWYQTSADKREVTYTNLDPGNYVFEMKASNNDGIWSDEVAKVSIIILPPWWETWWIRVFAVIALILSGRLYFQYRTKSVQIRNKALEREVQNRTHDLVESNELLKEQNEEVSRQSEKILEQQEALLQSNTAAEERNKALQSVNNVKDMLFSVIAHDIRNPVHNFKTLIQLALMDVPLQTKEILLQAEKQAKSLHSMTTSLLDWAIFQSQKVELNKELVSTQDLCKEMVEEINPLAIAKDISLSFQSSTNYHSFCDRNALKTVLRNIITNAVKFTPINGNIVVSITSDNPDSLDISISDTGLGMDGDKLKSLFQFIPSKKTRGTSGEMGSGLGLVFSYELHKLNGGNIFAESTVGKGAVFHIVLPSVALPAEAIISIEPQKSNEEIPDPVENIDFEKTAGSLKGKVAFLIDDDEVLRGSVNRFLCDVFEIYQFGTAEEAWQQLKNITPDLIISDVNLPGISGFEFVKKVKGNESTSHIASFILSGETSAESRLKGFEYGADAYITKPFEKNTLLNKIVSYFFNQDKRIRKFLFSTEAEIGSLTDNPINKAFLEKLLKLIESDLGNAELNADILCKEMGFSRSSLYRKLKSLTGHSVNDFIRNIRLRKSMELLDKKELNISEISYEVGFNSLSYFTSSFKKHFGFSPTEFIKRK